MRYKARMKKGNVEAFEEHEGAVTNSIDFICEIMIKEHKINIKYSKVAEVRKQA